MNNITNSNYSLFQVKRLLHSSSPLYSVHFNAFEATLISTFFEDAFGGDAFGEDTLGGDALEETLNINIIEEDTLTRKATTMEEEKINWVEDTEEMYPFEEEIVEKKPAKAVDTVEKKPAKAVATVEKKPAKAVATVRKKPAKKVVRRKVTIKKETSYPGLMRLGSYLAFREGKEGMKKLQKEGTKTEEQVEEQLEQKYMEEMMRQPGVCKNPDGEMFQTFDVEALEEGKIQQLISEWESRPQIVSVREGGKTLPYVSLLAMGPHSPYIRGPDFSKEQSKHDTGGDVFRGFEKEVINH